MAKSNPYGRQIFLSRREISELKAMVSHQFEYVLEELTEQEACLKRYHDEKDYYLNRIHDGNEATYNASVKITEDAIDTYQKELAFLRRLDKKLYYYVDASPEEVQ